MSNQVQDSISDELKEVLYQAIMVIAYRDGDISNENGHYATTDCDSLIRLESALCSYLGTSSDDIDLQEAIALLEAKGIVEPANNPNYCAIHGVTISNHTREPWAANGAHVESKYGHGVVNDGWIIADTFGIDRKANARRIVACVNACRGIGTETLERFVDEHKPEKGFGLHRESALVAQRDELLAAMRKLACLGNGDQYGNSEGNIIAQEAIAKWEVQNG